MDIQYAILGLLNWQPFSGYDLKKIISESDLFYWSGNNNQIYNSLVQLHKQGWVSQQVQYQESLPARKIYSITAEGQAALREWLLSSPELPELHNAFLIQLALADSLSEDELDGLLGRYAEEIAVQLRMRRVQAQRSAGDAPAHANSRSPREGFIWQRIAENMVAVYQAELDWVNALREELREKAYLKK